MSIINSISTSNSWYTQSTTRVSNSQQEKDKIQQQKDNNQDLYAYTNVNFMQSNQNSTYTNPLDSLVASGTISQDQESAIQDAFKSSASSQQSQSTSPFDNTLDSLVSSGTISQSQEDSIKESIQAAMDNNEQSTTGL